VIDFGVLDGGYVSSDASDGNATDGANGRNATARNAGDARRRLCDAAAAADADIEGSAFSEKDPLQSERRAAEGRGERKEEEEEEEGW
jgi:hypothetical protein